jgi:thiol-disulfide isomerase/thioredoxin
MGGGRLPIKFAIRALTVLLVLCGAALAVLVFRPSRPEPVPPQQTVSTTPAQALGQFIALDPRPPAPALVFTTRAGEPKQLADFREHLVLVNLWATWCAPCVEEMPALDRLQTKLGAALTVLAISEDRRGADLVEPFLTQHGINNLGIYLDPKSAATDAFGVQGLPTSFLIDGDGKIIGKLEGAAKWDEPAMLAVLQRYIAAK